MYAGSSPTVVGTETLVNENTYALIVVATGLITLVCTSAMSRNSGDESVLAPDVEAKFPDFLSISLFKKLRKFAISKVQVKIRDFESKNKLQNEDQVLGKS